VSGLALDGDVLYVGGTFDQVNLPTGTFASIDAATGTVVTSGARLQSRVTAIAADGAGGWYVATLTWAFDTSHADVNHVLAGGSVDPAWRRPDFGLSIVSVLALEGGRLFVGGSITTVDGLPRAGIVALDSTSGAVLPWTADLTFTAGSAWPSVGGIAALPGRLYISGLFTHVGGAARANFAVLDAATGSALPPTLPGVAGGYLGPPVVAGNRVYVRGSCRTSLYEICAYDLDLVPLAGWTFPLSNVIPGPMAASDTAVLATYRVSDNPVTERTVKLDPATGVELAWSALTTTGVVVSTTLAGGRVYVGGDFTSVNGQERSHLAAVDVATGALDPWAPLVGGMVTAVSVQGGSVGIGGEFRGVGGIRKRNLVAIDLLTGRPRSPNAPDLPFGAVAFQKVGDVMVVAGDSNSARNVYAFSAGTGALLPWSMTTDGAVLALAADSQRLYLGGRFSVVGGVARRGVAAVDLESGTVSNWSAAAMPLVSTLAVAHGVLYAGGGFGGYPGGGGEPYNYVAAFDLESGATLPFSPRPAMTYTSGIAFHQDRVLLAGGSADALEWVDRTSGAPVLPATAVSGSVSAAVQVGDAVFVAGLTTDLTSVLVVVDAPSGRMQVFDGTYGPLAASDAYIAMAGRVIRRPGPGAPRGLTASVAGTAVTLGWQAGAPPAPTGFVVEAGTSSGATDVGAFAVGLATTATGTLPPGTYVIRVRGVSAAGAGAASSEVIVTVPATATPPGAPGTLSATVAGGAVSLAWGAAPGNATTYIVEAGTASGLSNIGAWATGYLDTRLVTAAPPGTYVVRIRAANAFGIGPPSNEVTVVVP
jgi:hypothetical protein